MIDIYARTFRVATFLDDVETVPARRRLSAVARIRRKLARWSGR